jgi:trigger factor
VKVSRTELPPRQVSLAIEVEQERVERSMEQAYRRLAARVDVPGFRRGKAPRPMIERYIGRDRIVEDALDHLVPEVVNEAIEQEGVAAYTRPRVESIDLDPLRVKAVVPLAPRVELGDYKRQLRVAAEEPNIEPDQVDSVIERLRESYAQWVPVDRPVQIGDRVGIDLRGVVTGSGRQLLDSKDAEYVVDPEGAQPAPGFAEQLVGMTAGDNKAFSLVLPEDYREPELGGQPVEFTVELHWIKERELPAVDDELAQQVGDYPDVATLRSTIASQLRQREEERIRQQLEESALDKLVELSTVEFPPQLIEHQTDHMLEQFTRNVEQQGLQLEQYLRLTGKDADGLRQEVRGEAETRVRRSLALDAFADAEQIDVQEQEIEEEVRRAAAGASEREAVERLALANPNTLARVREVTRERKALARLVGLATGDGATQISTESAATSDTGKTQQQQEKEPAAEGDAALASSGATEDDRGKA